MGSEGGLVPDFPHELIIKQEVTRALVWQWLIHFPYAILLKDVTATPPRALLKQEATPTTPSSESNTVNKPAFLLEMK